MSDLATSLKLRQTRHNARSSREGAGTRGEEKHVIGVCRRLKIWRSSSFGNSSMTGGQDEKCIAPKTGIVDLKSQEGKSGSSRYESYALTVLSSAAKKSRSRNVAFSVSAIFTRCSPGHALPRMQMFSYSPTSAASRLSCVNFEAIPQLGVLPVDKRGDAAATGKPQ